MLSYLFSKIPFSPGGEPPPWKIRGIQAPKRGKEKGKKRREKKGREKKSERSETKIPCVSSAKELKTLRQYMYNIRRRADRIHM